MKQNTKTIIVLVISILFTNAMGIIGAAAADTTTVEDVLEARYPIEATFVIEGDNVTTVVDVRLSSAQNVRLLMDGEKVLGDDLTWVFESRTRREHVYEILRDGVTTNHAVGIKVGGTAYLYIGGSTFIGEWTNPEMLRRVPVITTMATAIARPPEVAIDLINKPEVKEFPEIAASTRFVNRVRPEIAVKTMFTKEIVGPEIAVSTMFMDEDPEIAVSTMFVAEVTPTPEIATKTRFALLRELLYLD